MVQKEQPEFFNSDKKHFFVEVTDKMRREAKSMQRTSNETDTSDSRDSERSQKDSLVGKIGEIALKKFFDKHNVPVSFHSGWMYDMKLNGYEAEVKTRDYTQTSPNYADLLVRDRVDTNWSPADVDIVVQVMVNGKQTDKAYITGYGYGEYVAQCDLFRKAKTHRTRKMSHSDLQPIEDLL